VDYMVGHGFATLFLASVYGEEEDRDRRLQLRDVLNRAVQFTSEAQTDDGGWGYLSAADGNAKSALMPTVFQLQALRAARNAGINVPFALIDKGQMYLLKNVDPNTPGGQAWAALAGAFAAGEYDAPLARKWLKIAEQQPPALGKGGKSFEGEFLNVYHAQVLYALGQDGYGKLFPDARPQERLTWSMYQ